jgi:hypothetical protein
MFPSRPNIFGTKFPHLGVNFAYLWDGVPKISAQQILHLRFKIRVSLCDRVVAFLIVVPPNRTLSPPRIYRKRTTVLYFDIVQADRKMLDNYITRSMTRDVSDRKSWRNKISTTTEQNEVLEAAREIFPPKSKILVLNPPPAWGSNLGHLWDGAPKISARVRGDISRAVSKTPFYLMLVEICFAITWCILPAF